MFYVSRSPDGEILAISRQALSGNEMLDEQSPEILKFLAVAPDKEVLGDSDADFVRVIEDVIDTLIQNNVIRLTDLPPAAQKKLMTRKGIRNALGGALNLLGNDEMII